MWTCASLCAIVLLNCSLVSPASAYRSSSLVRDLGQDSFTFSESAFENGTIYYAVCQGTANRTDSKQKECLLRRVQADFSGGSPKEDECKVILQADTADGLVVRDYSKIDPLGENRAILRWLELYYHRCSASGRFCDDKYHLRFSVVDFTTCRVKTTRISPDLDRLFENKAHWKHVKSVDGLRNYDRSYEFPKDYDYNWPIYRTGDEDDFEIVAIVKTPGEMRSVDVLTTRIDAEANASKVDRMLSYYHHPYPQLLIFPLEKDQGYLQITSHGDPLSLAILGPPDNSFVSVAHIKPNGEVQNLTRIDDVYSPTVSLANGLIGICAHEYHKEAKCAQFKLGDERIEWFSTAIFYEGTGVSGTRRAIYNLPNGEGFLTHLIVNDQDRDLVDRYLIKIGLDGKVKQYLEPGMRCAKYPEEAGFNKLYQDEQGNYCMSTACVKKTELDVAGHESSYVKLQSKCYEPSDFKNVTKFDVKIYIGLFNKYELTFE